MASRILRRVRDMLDVDAAAIGDGKAPVYRTASSKHVYETPYTVGGTDVAVADGGTGASTAAVARTNLGVEGYGRTTFSNAAVTIAASDVVVTQVGTMSASRVATLPAASAVPAGWEIIVADDSGSVTLANSIVVTRVGSDTVGGLSSTAITQAYGWRRLISDGTSKWSYDSFNSGARRGGGLSLNLTAVAFPKWRRAMARVRAGTGDGRILCVGDSGTLGGYAGTVPYSYPSQLQTLLNAQGVTAKGGAIWSNLATATSPPTDSRVVKGTGWINSATFNTRAWGGGGWEAPSGAAGSLSFTFPHSIDTIVVYYIKYPAIQGASTVNVDGGASLGTIDGNAAEAVGKTTFSCAAGTHTINITGPTGGMISILAVEAFLSSARGILVSNAGKGSTTAGDWTGIAYAWDFLPLFDSYQPDLTLILLGLNDAAGSVSAATFETNMTTLVTKAQLYGDVLVMTCYPSGLASASQEILYIPACGNIAQAKTCGMLDINGRFVNYTTSNAVGLYSDTVHLNTVGYADLAQAILPILKDM